MNNKFYLLDYTLNIDTLCFKIKNPLFPKHYEKWETSNKIYYQTLRTVKSKINNSSISIRYYPFYNCISIWIESVPCVLYGSSQKMFKKEDFPTLLKFIVKLLNDVTGLSEEDFRAWLSNSKCPTAEFSLIIPEGNELLIQ